MSLRKRPAPALPPAPKPTPWTSLAGPLSLLAIGLGGVVAWSSTDLDHESSMGLMILSVATVTLAGYLGLSALGVDLTGDSDSVSFDGDSD